MFFRVRGCSGISGGFAAEGGGFLHSRSLIVVLSYWMCGATTPMVVTTVERDECHRILILSSTILTAGCRHADKNIQS